MEVIIALLVLWILLRRSRKKKLKGPVDQWDAFEEEAKKQSKEQERYDRYMMGLPELVGDETYSMEVSGTLAYKETLDNFLSWMERYHPGKSEINVILETVESDGDYGEEIRIEAGQAVIGFISYEDDDEIIDELDELGGKARASARLVRLPNGENSLAIDVVRPLRLS